MSRRQPQPSASSASLPPALSTRARTAAAAGVSPAPDVVAESDRRVRPRHSSSPTSPAAAAADAAASSSRPSAAVRLLYRHALESIFAFLNLAELHVVAQVAQGWRAAVSSMKSIEQGVCFVPESQLQALSSSALAKHVNHICMHKDAAVGSELMHRIVARATQLASLVCTLTEGSFGALSRDLRVLSLQLPEEMISSQDATQVNTLLGAIGACSQLEDLVLKTPQWLGSINLSPLQQPPQLANFRIQSSSPTCACQGVHAIFDNTVSDAQVNQLRALHMLQRFSMLPMNTALMARLLRQPHQLKWQQWHIGGLELTEEVCTLLAQLPSQTSGVWSLDQSEDEPFRDFSFMKQLPQLKTVRLQLRCQRKVERAAMKMLATMQLSVIGLTESSTLTPADLSALLASQQNLQSLTLSHLSACAGKLTFLAHASLAASLRHLELVHTGPYTRAHLQRYLAPLRELRELLIVAGEPMPSRLQQQLTPPSKLLPQLRVFELELEEPEEESEEDEGDEAAAGSDSDV